MCTSPTLSCTWGCFTTNHITVFLCRVNSNRKAYVVKTDYKIKAIMLSSRRLPRSGFVSTSALTSAVRCWTALKTWATCSTAGTLERFTRPRCSTAPGSSTSFPTTGVISTCWRGDSTAVSTSGQPWTPTWDPSAASTDFSLSLSCFLVFFQCTFNKKCVSLHVSFCIYGQKGTDSWSHEIYKENIIKINKHENIWNTICEDHWINISCVAKCCHL